MPGVTKRLFLAVSLPDPVKKNLENCQRELNKCGAAAKWVKPENIHITLKFLGSVPQEKIKPLIKVIEKGFGRLKCFPAICDRIGYFPPDNAPKVVWAELTGEKNLFKDLSGAIEEILSKSGFPKEKREFQAHATLARLRSSRNALALIEKINELNRDFKKMPVRIDNITLFESQLGSLGPTYTPLHQIKLK
jgi:2'-5' RNA ligase